MPPCPASTSSPWKSSRSTCPSSPAPTRTRTAFCLHHHHHQHRRHGRSGDVAPLDHQRRQGHRRRRSGPGRGRQPAAARPGEAFQYTSAAAACARPAAPCAWQLLLRGRGRRPQFEAPSLFLLDAGRRPPARPALTPGRIDPNDPVQQLLARPGPAAGLAQRHLWLIAAGLGARGPRFAQAAATVRPGRLVQAAPGSRPWQRLQAWWWRFTGRWTSRRCWRISALRPRTALASELAERLRHKLLPAHARNTWTRRSCSLLALPSEFDARWLAALTTRRARSACWPC